MRRIKRMRRETIHRIYTEDKNKKAIVDLVGKQFESFTLQPTLGYYRGKPEKSIVIEIVGSTAIKIKRLRGTNSEDERSSQF